MLCNKSLIVVYEIYDTSFSTTAHNKRKICFFLPFGFLMFIAIYLIIKLLHYPILVQILISYVHATIFCFDINKNLGVFVRRCFVQNTFASIYCKTS